MKKLILLSAFYRNDKPGGVGVSLTNELDLDTIFNTLQTSYNQMWRQSVYESETGQLTKDLFGQLEFIGKMTKPLSMQLALMVIGNVYLLEKTGALKSDEFNGIQQIFQQ